MLRTGSGQPPLESEASGTRAIAVRIKGSERGGIARIVTPSTWGEVLKPFVFLDYFELHADRTGGFHPPAFWHRDSRNFF